MIGPVIPEIVIEELLAWHPVCGYPEPWDLVFASDYNFGKTPLWPDSLRTKILQPVARRVGIRKQIGWHTFRRTYSSLLAETGNDVKVVQELMRHSKLSTTMEVSTQHGGLYTGRHVEETCRAAQGRRCDSRNLAGWSKASELSSVETTSRMLQLVSKEHRLKKLLAVGKTEPPRVRALLGALAEVLGTPSSTLEKMRATLNPSSRFNFDQFAGLPTARKSVLPQ